MHSLSRSFLLGVGAAAVTTTLLATLAAFLVFRNDLARSETEHLQQYVDQRAVVVSGRFAAISRIQEQAATDLVTRMDGLGDDRAQAVLDLHLPLGGDGTRRSRPQDFDGAYDAGGALISGMGAFLSDGDAVAPEERLALAAAFDVVHEVGTGIRSAYDNFYFATAHNRMVMFAPTRPDRLMFYRHDAPADLDFSRQEMMRMVGPAADPSGRTRCTSLQHLIQDHQGRRLATACMTPVYRQGRYLGAFGSSIQLRDYLSRSAAGADIPHATSLLLRAEGDVVAVTGRTPELAPSPETLSRLERDLGVAKLAAALRADGRARGVMASPDGRSVIGFARVPGPDWWFVLAYPQAELRASALRSASWILGLGLLAALVQTALIVTLAHRTITDPLKRLAASCEVDAPTGDLERRPDEIGVLGRALRDERAAREAVLTSLEARVAARTAELERASTEKDRFLANMSHELRTPLNGVIAVSEVLAGLQDSPQAEEMARLIVSSSRLLEHVLSDILDVSRLEGGELQLAAEPFDLAEALAHVCELHRVVAEAKGLTLSAAVSPALAGLWTGDAIRLTQVVSNLLSNAVKFTETGEVTLRAVAGAEGVAITVDDTGIGFDGEVGARLFQRFEQADPSISRRFGGTGLGLSICRSLTQAMGGEIRVISEPGRGSSFTVELPLRRAAAPPASGAAEADAEAQLAGVRVLLAEDHPTNQKVVELILEAAGVRLVVVESGREALEALAASPFDLVLMDMQMPEMDGLSATRLWREREATLQLPRTPVVMLTAHALDEHVEESLRAGADHHLSKPLRAAELLSVVAALTAEDIRRAAA